MSAANTAEETPQEVLKKLEQEYTNDATALNNLKAELLEKTEQIRIQQEKVLRSLSSLANYKEQFLVSMIRQLQAPKPAEQAPKQTEKTPLATVQEERQDNVA
jgi:hypothetical protein